MISRMKARILESLFSTFNANKKSLKERYEDIKWDIEEIDKLKSYPEWNVYENKLLAKLEASYDGLRGARNVQEMAFYQGAIEQLERILTIPKAMRERELELKKEVENASARTKARAEHSK